MPDAGSKTGSAESSADRASVIAGADAADIVAVGVELANPGAAAIAVVIISVIARSDCAADHSRADQRAADAPAKASCLCRLRAGCDAAGDGKGGKRECGNFGFDRHRKLHPVAGGPLWSACPVGRRLFESGSITDR